MKTEKLAIKLGFKEHKSSDNSLILDFRGYEIMYIKDVSKFIFLGKEAVSHGRYVWDENPEDCTNKKAKSTWYLIDEIIKLNKTEDWEQDYINVVQSLLLQMFLSGTHKIADDGRSSGNQYRMAESRYKAIKEVSK